MSLVDPVVVSGARLVEAVLRYGRGVPEELVVLRGGSSRGLARLVSTAESKGVRVRLIDAADVAQAPSPVIEKPGTAGGGCATSASSDVALALGAREPVALESAVSAPPAAALVLALEGVEDPHNLGAILRAAAAFGADAVVLDRHAREMPRDVVARASAGASECLPLVFADDLVRALAGLAALKVECVAATPDDATSAFDMTWPARACLVIGGERRGLSRAALDECPRRVTIPMARSVDSLPAVVSASALLFAAARDRQRR